MSTNNKTSVLVESQLPEFLNEEGPRFQSFVRAYYEWLETNNQITERAKNLLNYQDLENTTEEFLEFFRREILSSFPKSILADKKLVYKRIIDLYNSKGSEQSFKLLFKLLYNEDIELYYPRVDILRASDGRWRQETVIRVSIPFAGDLNQFAGSEIEGQTSKAKAIVSRVTQTFETGVIVYELLLEKIRGTFVDNEQVRDSANNSGFIIASTGPLSRVSVIFGGSGHQIGDGVNFVSSSGASANGIVTSTIDDAINVSIVDGGSGYAINTPLTFTGGFGSGASWYVSAISNTETLSTFNDVISSVSNVILSTGSTFVSLGANTSSVSANLASANISSVLSSALGTSNVVVGTIAAVLPTTRGNYTTLPSVTARYNPIANQNLDDGSGGIKGFNASLAASKFAGSIQSVSINNPGTGYNRIDLVNIVNITRTALNATGSPFPTGVVNYPGAYFDTKGFLSWNNKLQDNYFYQDFSYVVKSRKSFNVYKQLMEDVIHPAGYKPFGEISYTANASFNITMDAYVDLSIENIQSITSTLAFGNTTFVLYVDPSSTTLTNTFGVPQLNFVIDVNSVSPTTTFGIADNNFTLDVPSIQPTVVFGLPDFTYIEPVSIESTVTIGIPDVYYQGDGTISNFLVNNIGDLSNTQIQEYDSFTINTIPGNRIFDGVGTNFTSQLYGGLVILVTDPISMEELTLTVAYIDDANTMAITSNATFSNGSLAFFNNVNYLIN